MLRVQAWQLVALQAVAGQVSLQAYYHSLHYLCYFWHHAVALLYSDIHEVELLFNLVHNAMLFLSSISPQSFLEAWKVCVSPYFNARMGSKESEISCTSTENAQTQKVTDGLKHVFLHHFIAFVDGKECNVIQTEC